MHGIIKPEPARLETTGTDRIDGLKAWVKRNRWFLILVVLPTLVAAAYYYLVAADQYQSEAHYIVRTADQPPATSGGIGQLFGLGGAMTPGRTDSLSVNDYLDSENAVAEIDRRVGLVARFRRSEADPLTRLRSDQPTPEALVKYFRKQVDIRVDAESGITVLKVRAFRPEDARVIIQEMLKLGEARVNLLNRRSEGDSLTAARRQLADAETGLADIQSRLTSFRQARGDLDPAGTGKAQIEMVSQLTVQLTQARAQFGAMRGIISPSSPQYIAAAARVRALEALVAAQSSRLTGGSQTIAARLGGYENLQVREGFAAKRYEVAAANLEQAQNRAARQQLYIVRVVEPNLPVKSEFPERGRLLATILFALLITYGIGWLIVAGVREHSI